jgi:hypothetical protein
MTLAWGSATRSGVGLGLGLTGAVGVGLTGVLGLGLADGPGLGVGLGPGFLEAGFSQAVKRRKHPSKAAADKTSNFFIKHSFGIRKLGISKLGN